MRRGYAGAAAPQKARAPAPSPPRSTAGAASPDGAAVPAVDRARGTPAPRAPAPDRPGIPVPPAPAPRPRAWGSGRRAGPPPARPASNRSSPRTPRRSHAPSHPPAHAPHPTESPARASDTIPTADDGARSPAPASRQPRSTPRHDRAYGAPALAIDRLFRRPAS